MNMFSPFATYRTRHLRTRTNSQAVTDRQERLTGFNQKALTQAKVILIGAGGLGGDTGEALVRKGVGTLVILDGDLVEPTNLNRQHFYGHDLYKNKARKLTRNLAKEGFCGTLIQGYGFSFEEALERGIDLLATVAIVGVDNNPGRIAASRFYWKQSVPVIFTAVSREADHGYVFIQKPAEACFGCLFPHAVNDGTYPCPGTPAVKDILKDVAALWFTGWTACSWTACGAGTPNPSSSTARSPAGIAILPGATIAHSAKAILVPC